VLIILVYKLINSFTSLAYLLSIFNDASGSSEYKESSDKMIFEERKIGKDEAEIVWPRVT